MQLIKTQLAAISVLDTALWDPKGQACAGPVRVFNLLGGRTNGKMRVEVQPSVCV